eukprot:1138614-Pelagomonas_calceolata.AAC.2
MPARQHCIGEEGTQKERTTWTPTIAARTAARTHMLCTAGTGRGMHVAPIYHTGRSQHLLCMPALKRITGAYGPALATHAPLTAMSATCNSCT